MLLLVLTVLTSHTLMFVSGNTDFRIFFNLQQALDFFKNYTTPLAQSILYTFQHDCCAVQDPVIPRLRKPFVVIEGNERKSRNIVAMRLAKLIHGRYLVHPAHCLQTYTNQLPKGTMFRRAFYILSLYAISCDVKLHLSLSRGVVVNGYWWDILVYALVQAFPPDVTHSPTNSMFDFPEGLFHPDMIFFLNFPDDLYKLQPTTRSPSSWKSRMLKVYRDLANGRSLELVDLTGSLRPTTDTIYRHIVRNLSAHRDVWFNSGMWF